MLKNLNGLYFRGQLKNVDEECPSFSSGAAMFLGCPLDPVHSRNPPARPTTMIAYLAFGSVYQRVVLTVRD